MSDYISLKVLIAKVEKQNCNPCKRRGVYLDGEQCRSCVLNRVLKQLRRMPTVDVAPMRYGKWVTRNKKKNTAPNHEAKMDE